MKRIISLILLITIFLTGCTLKDKGLNADKTLTVSAVLFERQDSNLTFTAETVIQGQTDKGKIISFQGHSIKDTVKKAEEILVYSLLFSHCSAVIINENIRSDDLEELLFLVTEKQLPLSSVIMLFDSDKILEERETGLTGYELQYFFQKKNAENRLFRFYSHYLAMGSASLPVILKEKEGFKWTESRKIFPS